MTDVLDAVKAWLRRYGSYSKGAFTLLEKNRREPPSSATVVPNHAPLSTGASERSGVGGLWRRNDSVSRVTWGTSTKRSKPCLYGLQLTPWIAQ